MSDGAGVPSKPSTARTMRPADSASAREAVLAVPVEEPGPLDDLAVRLVAQHGGAAGRVLVVALDGDRRDPHRRGLRGRADVLGREPGTNVGTSAVAPGSRWAWIRRRAAAARSSSGRRLNVGPAR